jgi:replicative DNA helicase
LSTLESLNQYGNSFQQKVIGLLLTDRKFLIETADSLTDEYFENTSRKWIIKQIQKYFDEYHTNPTMDSIHIEVKKEENEILKIAVIEELKIAYSFSETSKDKDYIEQEFSKFCNNQQMKKAIMESVDLLPLGDYEAIRSLISKAVKDPESKNIGHNYDKDIEQRYRANNRNIIATPWSEINDITQGGYGAGDLVIFFGGPGSGKSWAMVEGAVAAAEQGKNVTVYSLELGDAYWGQRLDANMLNIEVEELPKHKDKIIEKLKSLKGKIIIKEYPPKRASLSDIERHQEQLRTQHNFISDIIFIDYLDLLRNTRSRGERKDDIDDIYTEAKGLAKTLNIPIVSPSQVNRAGSEDKVVEGNKAAGSFDKIMIGDLIISTSRLRKDKINNTSRWHIIKNRYGVDGLTYCCNFNGKTGKTIITGEYIEDEDEEPKAKQKTQSDFNNDDKDYIRKQFFNN